MLFYWFFALKLTARYLRTEKLYTCSRLKNYESNHTYKQYRNKRKKGEILGKYAFIIYPLIQYLSYSLLNGADECDGIKLKTLHKYKWNHFVSSSLSKFTFVCQLMVQCRMTTVIQHSVDDKQLKRKTANSARRRKIVPFDLVLLHIFEAPLLLQHVCFVPTFVLPECALYLYKLCFFFHFSFFMHTP